MSAVFGLTTHFQRSVITVNACGVAVLNAVNKKVKIKLIQIESWVGIYSEPVGVISEIHPHVGCRSLGQRYGWRGRRSRRGGRSGCGRRFWCGGNRRLGWGNEHSDGDFLSHHPRDLDGRFYDLSDWNLNRSLDYPGDRHRDFNFHSLIHQPGNLHLLNNRFRSSAGDGQHNC